MSNILIGSTFSHHHLNYLKLSIDQALAEALSFGFSH